MAKLTAKARRALPSKDFAEPGKRAYPIQNPNHARAALSRVSEYGTPAEKAQVRAAVHRKYPNMGKPLSNLPDGSQKSLHERGHHEAQLASHLKGRVVDHDAFHALDHGGDKDHMIGREKGKKSY